MDIIRVLIVDDHVVVREGTRALLEHDPGLQVVGEAGTGKETVVLTRTLRPDVILLDLALPDLNGIEVARRVRDLPQETKIVVLSAYDDDDYVVAAIEAGVSGYLLKTARGQEVIDTIHAVVQGQVVLHPTVLAKLHYSLSRAEEASIADLTPRELEVLEGAARGLHNQEIADMLFISVRTVEGHLNHILTKLGVSSRTEAVLIGLAQRWFDLKDLPTGQKSMKPATPRDGH